MPLGTVVEAYPGTEGPSSCVEAFEIEVGASGEARVAAAIVTIFLATRTRPCC